MLGDRGSCCWVPHSAHAIKGLVYADGIHLKASSPEQWQAIIEALRCLMHMDIVSETNMMVIPDLPTQLWLSHAMAIL